MVNRMAAMRLLHDSKGRPQTYVLTVGDLIDFLSDHPDDTPLVCSVEGSIEVRPVELVQSDLFDIQDGKGTCEALLVVLDYHR